ncbi:NADH-quinone oxidoreductase subunit C [Berryella intestinalis]|uniref:NADH-quinone oxidoreductase subunit C n=1 Tax=Berryella intestinalis TaxID=1531429 RepID=UPI00068B1489|nr:NADH-quinone oxidoreductase subunit C [Berryella intestinalis]
MDFKGTFSDLELDRVHDEAVLRMDGGWRLANIHAVNTESGIDVYYTYVKDGVFENLAVRGLTPDMPVPSVTDVYFSAFVFENETRELFGVDLHDIALDFGGTLYGTVETEPMTFISPEQKEAKEKAKKAALAKAARERKAAAQAAKAEQESASDGAKAVPDAASDETEAGER